MENINMSTTQIIKSLQNGDFYYDEIVGFLLFLFLIIAISLFWVAFKGLKLWKAKSKMEVDLLNRIDGRLQTMEQSMLCKSETMSGMDGEEKKNDFDEMNAVLAVDKQGSACRRDLNSNLRNIGKNGRIYSEEEIEMQIRE